MAAKPWPRRLDSRITPPNPLDGRERDIHPDAAACEEVGRLARREARKKQEREERAVVGGVRQRRRDGADLHGARADPLHVDPRAVVLDGDREPPRELPRADRHGPRLALARRHAQRGLLDAVGDRVADELDARLDEELRDAAIDRLARPLRAHDHRATDPTGLGLDGSREPREEPAQRGEPHRGELAPRVRDAVAQDLVAAPEVLRGLVELLAERRERRRGPLDAAQRGGGCAPRARRSDEPEGVCEVRAEPAELARLLPCDLDAGREPLADEIDRHEPVEQGVHGPGRDADRRLLGEAARLVVLRAHRGALRRWMRARAAA